ncbi:MAG: hypothetical protein Q7R22_011380 [Verrucomicrobiota bacterium JB025]|nr:hypothetical protein [Verrucomicrobiota bacterium JB025]
MIEASIYHGSLPLELEGGSCSVGKEGVLDSSTHRILTSFPDWESDAISAGFKRGAKTGQFHSMWVESLEVAPESAETAIVTARCIGLVCAGEKRLRKLGVAGRTVAVGPYERTILAWVDGEEGEEPGVEEGEADDNEEEKTEEGIITKVKRRVPKLKSDGEVAYRKIAAGEGIFDRWNVSEAALTVNDTYFVTKMPDTKVVGTNVTPPNPPDPPVNPWQSWSDDTRGNYPHGWVLQGRKVVEHFRLSDKQGLWSVIDSFAFLYPYSPD